MSVQIPKVKKTVKIRDNKQIFDETNNLAEFWQAGGTWSMDRYILEIQFTEAGV